MCDSRSDLLKFVYNNKYWFWKDLLFAMDTNLTYYGAAGIDSKQREVAALPSIIKADRDKSDRVESEEPVKTQTKKRILFTRLTHFSKHTKSTYYIDIWTILVGFDLFLYKPLYHNFFQSSGFWSWYWY